MGQWGRVQGEWEEKVGTSAALQSVDGDSTACLPSSPSVSIHFYCLYHHTLP